MNEILALGNRAVGEQCPGGGGRGSCFGEPGTGTGAGEPRPMLVSSSAMLPLDLFLCVVIIFEAEAVAALFVLDLGDVVFQSRV